MARNQLKASHRPVLAWRRRAAVISAKAAAVAALARHLALFRSET